MHREAVSGLFPLWERPHDTAFRCCQHHGPGHDQSLWDRGLIVKQDDLWKMRRKIQVPEEKIDSVADS